MQIWFIDSFGHLFFEKKGSNDIGIGQLRGRDTEREKKERINGKKDF